MGEIVEGYRAHRRAALPPRALDAPAAGHGRGRRRGAAARGARGARAHRGRPPADAGLLQAGARGGLLPRRPPPGQHALGRRPDLAARPRHGRAARRADTRRQLFLVLLAFAQGDVDLLADVSLDLSGVADAASRPRGLPRRHRRGGHRDARPLAAGDQPGRAAQPADRDLGPPRGPAAARLRHGRQGARPGRRRGLRARARSSTRSRRRGASSCAASRGGWPGASTRSRSSTRPSGCATGRARSPTGLATVVGSRPGRQLEVKFTSARLEQKVVRAGRAVALGLGAGLTWVAATQASTSDRIDPRLSRTLHGRRRRALGLVRRRGRAHALAQAAGRARARARR